MTLLTAHRILIGAAAAFFAFYGLWEFAGIRAGGGSGGTLRGFLGLLASLIFLIYLRTLRSGESRRDARPDGGSR